MKMTSKRRRTKQEILEQKAEEIKKKTEVSQKMRDSDAMLEAVKAAEEQAEMHKGAAYSMQRLIDEGILTVDENGNFIPGPGRQQEEQQN